MQDRNDRRIVTVWADPRAAESPDASYRLKTYRSRPAGSLTQESAEGTAEPPRFGDFSSQLNGEAGCSDPEGEGGARCS